MLSLPVCHHVVLIRSNSTGMIDIKEGRRGGGHIMKRNRWFNNKAVIQHHCPATVTKANLIEVMNIPDYYRQSNHQSMAGRWMGQIGSSFKGIKHQ